MTPSNVGLAVVTNILSARLASHGGSLQTPSLRNRTRRRAATGRTRPRGRLPRARALPRRRRRRCRRRRSPAERRMRSGAHLPGQSRRLRRRKSARVSTHGGAPAPLPRRPFCPSRQHCCRRWRRALRRKPCRTGCLSGCRCRTGRRTGAGTSRCRSVRRGRPRQPPASCETCRRRRRRPAGRGSTAWPSRSASA